MNYKYEDKDETFCTVRTPLLFMLKYPRDTVFNDIIVQIRHRDDFRDLLKFLLRNPPHKNFCKAVFYQEMRYRQQHWSTSFLRCTDDFVILRQKSLRQTSKYYIVMSPVGYFLVRWFDNEVEERRYEEGDDMFTTAGLVGNVDTYPLEETVKKLMKRMQKTNSVSKRNFIAKNLNLIAGKEIKLLVTTLKS